MKQIIQYQANDGFVGSEEECLQHDTVSRLVDIVDTFFYYDIGATSIAEAIYKHGQEILETLSAVYCVDEE